MSRQQRITETVTGIHTEEINAHFNLLPERYFVQTNDRELTLHIGMVNQLLHSISSADSLGSLRPIIEWIDEPARGLSIAHIVTWDRAGLFHKLAGAFSVAGLNIISAKITTRSDHIAIDTFEVSEPGSGPVRDGHARALFAQTVEAFLMGNHDLGAEIAAQIKKFGNPVPGATSPSVEVYLEIASPRAIVEIHAPDRFGLLYRVGHIFAEQGYSLTGARVHTHHGIAIDSFFLESDAKVALDSARLTQLKSALIGTLSQPSDGS